MKYFLSLFTALVFSFSAYCQVTGSSAVYCSVDSLRASVTGGIIPTSSGITADDNWSGVIPIGFTFDFYGTPNTQCIIGSNGCLGFDLANALAYNTWPIGNTLLGSTAAAPDVVNTVCVPWCDVYLPAGGTIDYSMQGVAPNRNFAVTWCSAAMYSCTTQWLTTQVILYESTNIVEVHIGHHTFCTSWNGGYAICGVKNAAGTAATVAPGRDYPANWTATDEAWRFSPVGGTSYTVSSIPYAPIPYAASAVYWYDSTSGAYLGTGPAIGVTPSVPTTYTAAVLGCHDTTKIYIHALPPGIAGGGTVPNIDTYRYNNPSICGVCNGSITLEGINPHEIDTVFYAFNGIMQPVIVDSAGIDSTITLTGLCEGVYSGIYVKVGTCPSNTVGPITLVGPHLAVSGDTSTNPTICGKADGTITLYGLFPSQPVSVSYTTGGVAGTATGTTLGDSSFTFTGLLAGNYTSIIATIGLCSAPAAPRTLVNPAPIPASFTFDTILHCTGDQVILTNTSTPSGYYAYWSFGDGSIDSSGAIPLSHIYADNPSYYGAYTITLVYNTYHNPACNSTVSVPIVFDHQISAAFTVNANAICVGTPITFTGNTVSMYGPSFSWNFGDGSPVASSATSATAPYTTTTDYGFPVAGHYTTTLTVTDTIGCQASATDTFESINIDVHTTVHDTSVCLRDSMALIAEVTVVPAYAPYNYSWTPTGTLGLDSSAITNFMSIGTYTFNITVTTPPLVLNPGGCSASDNETIVSYPPVTLTGVTASPQVISYGGSVYLNASGAVYYTWTPDNGTLSSNNINDPIATPVDSSTLYTVIGMNLYGCSDSATVLVNLNYAMSADMPTGFTPNGDGKNDIFRITKLKFQKLVEFRVFNRWGQQVFYTSNPENGWDGTFNGVPQDMDTYVYEITVGLDDGTLQIFKGSVELIR